MCKVLNFYLCKEIEIEFLQRIGVDTVSAISINGFEVGRTDNMFSRYSFPVPYNVLNEGSNLISVEFESPVEYSQRMFDQQAEE